MPVHIGELQSTAELHDDQEPVAAPLAATEDDVSERMRHDRMQRDRERLHAEGYAD